MGRRSGITVLLIALGIATFVWFRDQRDSVNSTVAAVVAGETRSLTPEPEIPINREVIAVPVDRSADATEDVDANLVRGTVVVVDADGREHDHETGMLLFRSWHGSMCSSGEEVPVQDGAWCARLAPGADLEVTRLLLSGRPVFVAKERLSISADRTLNIRGRWPRETTLRVIGAEARNDLVAITVEASDERDHDLEHPGLHVRDDVRTVSGQSPLVLEVDARAAQVCWCETLWVRAEGFAWGLIEVDYSLGGEHVLELRRSGKIEVTLLNYHPPATTDEATLARQRDHLGYLSPRLGAEQRHVQPVLRVRKAVDLDVEQELSEYRDAVARGSQSSGRPRPTEEEIRQVIIGRAGRSDSRRAVGHEV